MTAREATSVLKRFLRAELPRARRQLSATGTRRTGKPVHGARKSIKKLRAALRLAEKMAPRQALDPLVHSLRASAHALGPLRDHLVLAKTGTKLAGRRESPLPPPPAPEAAPLLRQARANLRRAGAQTHRLLAHELDPDGVASGLRRIYRRARKAMEQARDDGSDDNLHAWRRRAKDLYYVADLIDASPKLVKKLKRLTRLLGDDHDLAAFIRHHDSTADRPSHAALLKRAKKQRAPLQKKAFGLGKKLFDDKPRRFLRRVLD